MNNRRVIQIPGLLLIGAALAALVSLMLPSDVEAGGFGASPAEFIVSEVMPGETAERIVHINNKEDSPQTFDISVETTPEGSRREGRAEFPDNTWVTFDRESVTVDALSSEAVKVYIDIPKEQRWLEQDWETWIKITGASSGMFKTVLYIRLLVSTDSEVAPASSSTVWDNPGSVAGIAGAVVCGIIALLAGLWYMRRRRMPSVGSG